MSTSIAFTTNLPDPSRAGLIPDNMPTVADYEVIGQALAFWDEAKRTDPSSACERTVRHAIGLLQPIEEGETVAPVTLSRLLAKMLKHVILSSQNDDNYETNDEDLATTMAVYALWKVYKKTVRAMAVEIGSTALVIAVIAIDKLLGHTTGMDAILSVLVKSCVAVQESPTPSSRADYLTKLARLSKQCLTDTHRLLDGPACPATIRKKLQEVALPAVAWHSGITATILEVIAELPSPTPEEP